MASLSQRTHWLVDVARRTGLPDAEGLSVSGQTSARDAWEAVVCHCRVSYQDLAGHVATALRFKVANLGTAQATATKLLPASVVQTFQVFPLREDDRHLVVASSDPLNLNTEQAIAFASGRKPLMEVATPLALAEAIQAHYSPDRAVESLLARVETDVEDLVTRIDDGNAGDTEIDGGPAVKLTNLILRDAVTRRASDIHIQPGAGGGVVRFRVDGVLRHHMQLPEPVLRRVVSRIKILGNIDIANRLRPHDGRARLAISGHVFDMRVSTVPTRGAEKAVIRLLDPTSAARLENLGLPDPELRRFKQLLGERSGIILVTGPTGSGKTTTLYGALGQLSTADVNIMTVEDPIEYELPGVTQIQVQPKQGVTFASALRAILRQDPDIILLGEIRDAETAEVAVQASLTGHVVLATVHTNDATSAVRRLIDLGLNASALVDTLRGVVSQRLVRRACNQCAVRIDGTLSADEERLSATFGAAPTVRAVGCERCGGTGYRGRLPVVEVLTVTPALEGLIASDASGTHLEAAAVAAGMRPLRDVGLERAQRGETTFEELERVLGGATSDDDETAADHQTSSAFAPADSSAAAPTGSSAPAVLPPTIAGAHVLVVDDDGTNRTFARALLEREGCRVSEAEDGIAALEMLAKSAYSLMILDLEMPRLGGWDVLARVRGSVATAGVPIIVFTSSSDPNADTQLMDQGADDYLRKPIEPSRFLARVKAVLRRAGG